MLTQITIEHVAIISQLALSLEPGLIALTGETGSGKSLLLDALQLVFSKKLTARDYLRQGQKRGRVELSFSLAQHPERNRLQDQLTDWGIDCDLSEEDLIVSRELSSGSSRARIQGSMVPMETMETLSSALMEMHGQHDLHHLFGSNTHRDIIDRLGGEPLLSLKTELRKIYREWAERERERQLLTEKQAEFARQLDFCAFQLQELNEAGLGDPEEDTQLEVERKRLAASVDLNKALASALSSIQGSGNRDANPSEALQSALKNLSAWLEIAPELAPCLEHLEGAIANIEEAQQLLTRSNESIEFQPERLDAILDRQDQLSRLKRKYGQTLTEVMKQHEALQAEFDRLSRTEERATEIDAECEALKHRVTELSQALRELRQAIIAPFETAVMEHLADLMLDKAVFSVEMTPLEAPTEHGMDRLEFRFCANPGEPMKALGQVASGGELARVMLAIKLQTLAESGPFLILDEIDAGLSGQALRSLADKLALLSQRNQILVVTHHPLLAAKAQQHWHLEKSHFTHPDDGGTTVSARLLSNDPEREQILGQMASGEADDSTRQFVQALLKTG